ncbi:P1 family peptidase [Pseudaminobacter soli (ex Li et al. 2025)]|nr:P1 family peptidase [Mesorhizobium soli]
MTVDCRSNGLLDPVYMTVVDSVKEAVVNAMLAAEDMGGTPD